MPLLLRKQIRIGPYRLNLSKTGISHTLKVGPASVNSRQRRMRVDLPGPLAWTSKKWGQGKTRNKTAAPSNPWSRFAVPLLLGGLALLGAGLFTHLPAMSWAGSAGVPAALAAVLGPRRTVIAAVVLGLLGGGGWWGYGQVKAKAATVTGWRIVSVADGDTFTVERLGQKEKVRLIGVDTPETVKPRTPVQCYGPQASAFTHALQGKPVALTADPSQDDKDRYGRILRYATVDGADLGRTLLERGLAREYLYRPSGPYGHRAEYVAAQTKAKQSENGLWGAC